MKAQLHNIFKFIQFIHGDRVKKICLKYLPYRLHARLVPFPLPSSRGPKAHHVFDGSHLTITLPLLFFLLHVPSPTSGHRHRYGSVICFRRLRLPSRRPLRSMAPPPLPAPPRAALPRHRRRGTSGPRQTTPGSGGPRGDLRLRTFTRGAAGRACSSREGEEAEQARAAAGAGLARARGRARGRRPRAAFRGAR